LIKTAGVGTAAAAIAAPAIAQDMPEIRWRLTSSFPKNLDIATTTADNFVHRVGELTQGKLQIRWFAPGEIVPALQVIDAIQNGTVEAGYSASYYYVGKDPTFSFATTLPFGMNTRQHNAWMIVGGGLELINDFLRDYNTVYVPVGHTGAQMGGWFRKEIKSLDDLKGLKFRIAGFAGQVLSKLGVVPQQIAGGDIYPSLEKGTIDAAEWVGPYDDERLGFAKVAKYYYYPGWWEGCTQTGIFISLKEWEKLPPSYRTAINAVASELMNWALAKYDAGSPAALRRLVAAGAELRPFPRETMAAAYDIAFDLYEEMAAKNPKFKKIYDSWKPFRDEAYLWFRVAENTFDNFVFSQQATKKR
jgi:TRAP-type mannitol/chloroaromatic compound transport system substrate-binding protein